MTKEETLLAQQLYEAIQASQRNNTRSEQARQFVMGVSDLGTCKEYVRRILAEIPEQGEQDYLAAFIGSAIGAGFEEAIEQMFPHAVTQATVSTTLSGAFHDYRIIGHPDIILPWGVIDGKTKDGITAVERSGPTRQQLFQRHIYTKAAHEAGYLSVPLAEAKTANAWIDRSASERRIVVDMDVYDPAIVTEAALWLDDVYYAWEHGETAEKEPPRSWCEKACGHFEDCRALDSDVTGLIDDPFQLQAVEMYLEGAQLERRGKQLKDEAKADLDGVRGTTTEHSVRWIDVNASSFSVTRQAHRRLDIKPLRKK